MLSDDFEFVRREDLLEGRLAPGRRDAAVLFAIESRTAKLVAQFREATALAEVCLVDADGAHKIQSVLGQIDICDRLCTAIVSLPVSRARELKVWAHRLTPEARSEAVPARFCIRSDHRAEEFNLASDGGQILLPHSGGTCEVEITLAEPLIEEKRQRG